MLKNCFLPVNYTKQSSPIVCGEIICQSFDEFIIDCKLCKIKIFHFEEFVVHLKNSHLDLAANSKVKCKKEIVIDCQDEDEEHEENIVQTNAEEVDKDDVNIRRRARNVEKDYGFDIDGWDGGDDQFSNDSNDGSEYKPVQEEEQDNIKIIRDKKCSPKKLKEYACESCSKKYIDEKRLNIHVKLVHLREKNFKCTFCEEAFIDDRGLQKHIGVKHTGFECSTCHKKFSSNPILKRHMLLHIEEKEFICPECEKAFATKSLLRYHRRIHVNENLICEECGFKCRKRESLIVHKRNHTGEKPFACQQCPSRFASKSLLCEHMASHDPERKHICDVCGKSFNRPKALYHHKHLHLGIKKFVCKICGQAFAQAAGLSAHMRKHREDARGFRSEIQEPNLLNMFYN